MRQLVWSPGALDDLFRLQSFLHPKNPDAARRAITTIREGVKILSASPEIGRPLENYDSAYRERLIIFGESVYVVRYRIEKSEIILLTVRHGREAGN
jgi:plasmid stabilization system protein ParE